MCRLVQWCHGAPGFVQLLAEACKPQWQALFGKDLQTQAREAAMRAADTIWERGLLIKVRRQLVWHGKSKHGILCIMGHAPLTDRAECSNC